MNVEYGYRKEIKLSFHIDQMSAADKIRLVQDLLRSLLLTDGLGTEAFNDLRSFLEKALEESEP